MVCYIQGESGLDQSKKLNGTVKRLRIWGIVLLMNHEFLRANGRILGGEGGWSDACELSPSTFTSWIWELQLSGVRKKKRTEREARRLRDEAPASPAFFLEQWLATVASFHPPR